MSLQPAKLIAELAKLNPSGVAEMFILDATVAGGNVLYFCDGIRKASRPGLANEPIRFQGREYLPMPIQVTGFEFRAKGDLPLPKIRFANVFGLFTSMVLLFDDLVGATLTRKRTLYKFLDDGSAPDPEAEFQPDVYYIDRKVSENKTIVEFELGSSLDVDGVTLPRRQVQANLCGFRYRGPECGFAENRFVSTQAGEAYPLDLPISRYRGTYNLALNYSTQDAVSVPLSATSESFYYALQPSIGKPVTNADYWRRAQHYRGEWSSSTLYFRNDVVFVIGLGGERQYFLLDASTARGSTTEPPNLNYWKADQCGKTLSQCKRHHDPLELNRVLPFGAFPGTSRTLLV